MADDRDLTMLMVPADDGEDEHWHPEPEFDDCHVNAYCIDLEYRMCQFISRAQFVFGCMAWLTNGRVIRQLAGLEYGCQIVVQKEDFLRPDGGDANSRSSLHQRYAGLRCSFPREDLVDSTRTLSREASQRVQPVRCMGLADKSRRAMPRMHHKFLVACDVTRTEDENGDEHFRPRPMAVWTGSFNATENGERSLENAVVIHSPKIARAYAEEWSHVFALSEPLDWSSRYVDPEWRIGS